MKMLKDWQVFLLAIILLAVAFCVGCSGTPKSRKTEYPPVPSSYQLPKPAKFGIGDSRDARLP